MNHDDERRLQAIADEIIRKQNALPESSLDSKQQSAEEIIFDTLNISQPALKAAKAVFEMNDQAEIVSSQLDEPEIQELLTRRHELVMLARLGDNVRFMRGVTDLENAVDQFLRNPNTHFNSANVRKKLKSAEFDVYFKKYQYFNARAHAVTNTARERISAWMQIEVDTTPLDKTNELKNVHGQELGRVLMAMSAEMSKEGRGLRLREFGNLCQLFLTIVRKDREKTHLIAKSRNSSEETLTKILLEMTAVRPVDIQQEFEKLPTELVRTAKLGLPMYRLFVGFVDILADAIVEVDHPHHEVAVELLTLVNSFEFSGLNIPDGADTQPFNYQLFQGLANKDFYGLFNYQDFIMRLSELAETSPVNKEWYVAFRQYALAASHFFAHEVVFELDRAKQVIFGPETRSHTEIDLADALERIFQKGSSPMVQIMADGWNYEITGHSFRTDRFQLLVEGRRVQKNHYIVNAEVSLMNLEGEESTDKAMQKFRYQVRIENGIPTVYFPVVDSHNSDAVIEEQALEQVRLVIDSVYRQVIEEESQKESKTYQTREKSVNQRKFGNRQERLASYVKSDKKEPIQDPMSAESFRSESAEEDAVRLLVPSTLEVSPGLKSKMEKQGKKGSFAQIYADTADFLIRYNTSEDAKPGRGIQMTDVYGPNGETVWRFRPNSWTRAIAVSMSEGEAIVVHVDNRDSVYGDTTDMVKMVAREVDKYLRGQR